MPIVKEFKPVLEGKWAETPCQNSSELRSFRSHRTDMVPLTPTGSTLSAEQRHEPTGVRSTMEVQSTRGYVAHLMNSSQASGWMPWAVGVAIIQIIYFCVTILLVSATDTSSLSTLRYLLIWFLIIQPSACWIIILTGIAREGYRYLQNKRTTQAKDTRKILLKVFFKMCGVGICLVYSFLIFTMAWPGLLEGNGFSLNSVKGFDLIFASNLPAIPVFLLVYSLVCLGAIWRFQSGKCP